MLIEADGWGSSGKTNPKENFFNNTFFVDRKMTDLQFPTPAKAWVLVDEHPDSINDGYAGADCPNSRDYAWIIERTPAARGH